MRSGYAPTTAAVQVAKVTVDGREREAVSVSTVRELGGGGVPGVSASAAAEGSVEWARLGNAGSGPGYTPWTRTGNWPPAPGSVLQVDTGTALESFRALTGVVDSSSSMSDGEISSSIIDPVDRLHRRINLISYLHSMPPLVESGVPRNVGMSSDWVADIVMRRCAYFTTPYMAAGMSGVNVPGTGSMIPERGEVTASGRYGNTSFASQFLGSTFGWGIYSTESTYTPEGAIRASTGFTIATLVAARHEATASITASEGAGTWALGINASKSLFVSYNGTTVVSLPAATTYQRVEARITAGSVALVTDDGRQVSGAHPAPSAVTTTPVSSVRIAAQAGANISGIMVADMPNGHFLNYTLNARIVAGTNLTPALLASTRIDNRDGLSILTEIAEQTCRAFWWDEDGVLQWWPGDVLLGRAPSLTITSRDSLEALGWEESLRDTYRAVNVSHSVPAVTLSRRPNVPVWQGRGQSLDSGQYAEEIATPSSNEEWIMTQWSPTVAGDAFINEHNMGRRSVWGGVISDGTTTAWAQWTSGALTLGFQPIGNVAMKYTYQAGTIPANKTIELTFPNDASTTAVWSRWRSEKLPILRAYGRVDWTDANTSAGSGPAAGGDYEHDGGKWVQGVSGEAPAAIANFLATYLCVPRASAKGVSVVHDPRVQIGDVVIVRDEHAHGIELRALVTRVEQTVSKGDAEMSLDLFIMSGSPSVVTLGQHDASRSSGSMSTHNAEQSGESLTEHDSDPLHTA